MSEMTIEDSYRQIEDSTANLVRVDGITDGLLKERQLHAEAIGLVEKLLVNYQGIRVKDRRIIELATKIIGKRLSNDG